MKDVMNSLILSKGYIQLGEGIALYMKYDSTSNYQFVVYSFLKSDYYDLYNQWVEEGKMTIEQLSNHVIPAMMNQLTYRIMLPKDNKENWFEKRINEIISDYYWYNDGYGNSEKMKEYETYAK